MNFLRIATWDTNGLAAHKTEVETLIKINNLDILLVSETHLTEQRKIVIPGYNIYSTPHPDGTAHGGSAIIVKSNIKHHLLPEYKEAHLQATCIEIRDFNGPLNIAAVYSPPRHRISEASYTSFFRQLGHRFLVGGDWNAKHIHWGSRLTTKKGRELKKSIDKNKLQSLSSGKPTHWPSDVEKVPDLIDFFITKGISNLYIKIDSNDDSSSDHTPVLCTVSTTIIHKETAAKLYNKQTDWNTFRDILDEKIILTKKHSVDSVASYSSQNHVDRIRGNSFSTHSCHEDGELQNLKLNHFRRSASNLDIIFGKKTDSLVSTVSSTRSRLREFVERTFPDEKSPAHATNDLEYFNNPAETLDFEQKDSTNRDSSKKTRSKDNQLAKNTKDTKYQKHEKYQSKLAEYYNLPIKLPQDEFYQHLTRSKASSETATQNKFPGFSDAEFNEGFDKGNKSKSVEGTNLRRSRSLAVIREETFTDLQIQNNKSKRSQLIPRARLFDKPCFKDRLPGRTKNQSKEDTQENIYIKTTSSCFGAISDQKENKKEKTNTDSKGKRKKNKKELKDSYHSDELNGSWSKIEDSVKSGIHLSEDSINYSRNPSEIDSLDSNYLRKHCNFDPQDKENSISSDCECELSENSHQSEPRQLFILTDDSNQDNSNFEKNISREQSHHERSLSRESFSVFQNQNEQEKYQLSDCYNNTEKPQIVSVQRNFSNINSQTITKSAKNIESIDTLSLLSENETTVSSPADSITSYISISIPSSPDKSTNNRENLPTNFTEKTDEYSESKYNEHYAEPCSKELNINQNFSNKIIDDLNYIYSKVEKKDGEDRSEEISYYNYKSNSDLTQHNNKYCSTQSNGTESSSKNITTEPFVTTLIENQYYSLPDINISKCLRKSERIDAQLREEDPEKLRKENEYELSQNYSIYSRPVHQYGQLNSWKKEKLSLLTNETNVNIINEIFETGTDTLLSKHNNATSKNISIDCFSDTQQNEKEVHEIEGTIRTNKVLVKTDKKVLNNHFVDTSEKITVIASEKNRILPNNKSNGSIGDRHIEGFEKAKENIKRHYSLRQRSPKEGDQRFLAVSEFKNKLEERYTSLPEIKFNNNDPLISRVKTFRKSSAGCIDIVALGGHPFARNSSDESANKSDESKLNNLKTRFKSKNKEKEHTADNTNKVAFINIKLNKVIKATIPKFKKETSEKIAAAQIKFEQSPNKLIINTEWKQDLSEKKLNNMTRPQVIQVHDSKEANKSVGRLTQSVDVQKKHLEKNCNLTVNEKINRAIKTDLEYQEKLHSVKNYWSKLADQRRTGSESRQSDISFDENSVKDDLDSNSEKTVGDLVKSIETVKVVDSIKKIVNSKIDLWKDETEKLKGDSEVEEPSVRKIVKAAEEVISYSKDSIISSNDSYLRGSPEIKVVELGDDSNNKTQATLIKAKGKDCEDFDHVRYKVMKSELFKHSMIANYRKEAQFDGLLQYLQDYSFQELLVNNNVVIIEPVRTKIEPAPSKPSFKDSCRISPALLKKDGSQESISSKNKMTVRRHFFYHPIRVNKEIIEEELPNPDTVKKVRNLFEDTLKLRTPDNKHEPENFTKRSISCRQLNDEFDQNHLYMKRGRSDYICGNLRKKWDTASLSSGVSSGDLSSTNDNEDRVSPYTPKISSQQRKEYSSSSDEYLYESLGSNLYESQYVSQDILKKIRDCGTSITYYGGKVLNAKSAPESPMTKAIMDEIKGNQRQCNRECISCQIKCQNETCLCLDSKLKHQNKISSSYTSSDSGTRDQLRSPENKIRPESFPGFKFKLVKSNSCSSRLELAGANEHKPPRIRYRIARKSVDDPPIVIDSENSVKNKICRLESYNKGFVDTPFDKIDTIDTLGRKFTNKSLNEVNNEGNKNDCLAQECILESNETASNSNSGTVETNENKLPFEKKYYYVNGKTLNGKHDTGKFGEMVFEEFEVLESCYDSLNSNKSSFK